MSALEIRADDATDPRVVELLREHLAQAARHSPPGSVHALDVEGLRAPDVTFFAAWKGGELAGVGALRELDPTHGELKSMRTADAFLRRGVASRLLEHLLATARARGYGRVSLETGGTDDFAAARALYARFGFEACAPFGSYVADGFSVCMTRPLDPGPVGDLSA